MAYGHSELSFQDKISRDISISKERSSMLKKTYLLFSIAIAGMILGGKVGVSSPAVLSLFTGWLGWIIAMVALNAVPVLAMKFRYSPVGGTAALFADGFISGLVLAPMLYIGERLSGQYIVTSAAWITVAIFLGVTGYVYFSGTRWAPSRAMMTGIFFAILGAIVLNMFLNLGFLGTMIAAGIGAMGVITLVSGTSEVLHNDEIDTPVPGALMLFAGVFMVFQAVFYLLMQFAGGNRD